MVVGNGSPVDGKGGLLYLLIEPGGDVSRMNVRLIATSIE